MVWFIAAMLYLIAAQLVYQAGKREVAVEVLTYLACAMICWILSLLVVLPHLAPEVCK